MKIPMKMGTQFVIKRIQCFAKSFFVCGIPASNNNREIQFRTMLPFAFVDVLIIISMQFFFFFWPSLSKLEVV